MTDPTTTDRRIRYARAMALRDGHPAWPTEYEDDEQDYLRRADAAIKVADAERAVSLPPADQTALRDRLDAAIDDVFTRWQTGLGGQRPQDAIRDAVLAAVLREAAETGRGCPPDCPCRAVCIGTLKPAAGARQDGAQS
ncbi:hypothetical protein AB0D47_20050 [Streptomyces sp. NPDC048376]|uniref:hypothetical protein n=1 Tax=Streptomyces sp. NPDC048376 TaxID=3154926 RepID=UPI003430AABE